MSFTTAVRSALRQYVTFSGRARRSEFWWFYLFTLLVALGAAIIDDVLFGVRVADTQPYEVVSSASGPVGTVVALVLLLPTLAAAVRRLHDVGLSGWFLLVGLVGQVVDVSAKVADRGANDTLTCSIRWGDGSTSVGTISGDRCTGSHTYQKAATLTVTVSVTDDDGASDKDSVCITVRPVKTNRAPSVDAGRDVTATAGSTIRLHAEAKDPDGDRLTYAWTLKADAGTGCSFRDATTGHSTRMVCARAGTVWATVTVSDGVNAPVSDTVKVTVRAPQDPCATTPGSGAPKVHGRRRR